MITEPEVRERLSTIKYPGFSRDIVSFGLVKEVRISGSDVEVQITLTTNDPKVPATVHEAAVARLRALPGVGRVEVKIDIQSPAAATPAATGTQGIEGIKH